MTPAARLAAGIELLETIAAEPRPADALVSAYFRARRYIGAKDRAAVAEHCYNILRHYGRLRWWLERCAAPIVPRNLAIAAAMICDGIAAEEVTRLFSGGNYAPAELDPEERCLLRLMIGHTLEHPDMPEAIALECPPWAETGLRAALGDRFAPELRALLNPAPLDLRVNRVRSGRPAVLAALRDAGIRATVTRWSPLAIRVEGRPPLSAMQAFRDGWFEIQDEGSQLVALLVGARAGHQVVDFCAGAGGKALAVAAEMENRGRLIACDVLGGRLERAAERLRRAGLHNVSCRTLTGERDPWVKHHRQQFDRVLVDVPCTGTGVWRRNPDARWRPLGPGLGELVPLQASILASAARLVRLGGRLVYATCSLLPAENQDQIAAFLAATPEFRPLPLGEIWAQAVPGVPAPGPGPWLQLTPAGHETDGFFAAVLERQAVAKKVEPVEQDEA